MSAPSQPKVSQVVKRLPSTAKCISLLGCATLLPTSLAFLAPTAKAQIPNAQLPVDTITATPQAATPVDLGNFPYTDTCDIFDFPGCRTATVDLRFGQGSNIFLQSAVSGGVTFTQRTPTGERIVFRRSLVGGGLAFSRDILFFEEETRVPNASGVLLTELDSSPDES